MEDRVCYQENPDAISNQNNNNINQIRKKIKAKISESIQHSRSLRPSISYETPVRQKMTKPRMRSGNAGEIKEIREYLRGWLTESLTDLEKTLSSEPSQHFRQYRGRETHTQAFLIWEREKGRS